MGKIGRDFFWMRDIFPRAHYDTIGHTFLETRETSGCFMAKTGQSGSAAQRRAQERQQRQRREEARASALNKGKKVQSRGPTIRKKDRTGLYMVIGVVVLLAVIV